MMIDYEQERKDLERRLRNLGMWGVKFVRYGDKPQEADLHDEESAYIILRCDPRLLWAGAGAENDEDA